MTTTNIRSTALITRYVTTVDRIALLSAQLADLQRVEEHIRQDVLSEIGERRAVQVRGKLRILEPVVKTSISRACDDAEAVEFCKAHGLPVQTRTPEYIAPATFSKYAREGRLPEDMIERKETVSIAVH